MSFIDKTENISFYLLIALIDTDLKHKENIEEYSYYYKSGNLKLKIFIENCINEYSDGKINFPGLLLTSLQKHESGEYILPFGIWNGYREDGGLEFQVDFNIVKPNSFFSEERAKTIDFDYCACEVRKYDDRSKILSREYKSLYKLNSSYISHDNLIEVENYTPTELLEEIIKYGDMILPIIQKFISDDLLSIYEEIAEPKNWIQGFGRLYNRPVEGELHQYIPFYFEDGEESYDHPLSNIPVSFMKSHVEIATYCEQDALKLINEIMIFNGGVTSFKEYSTNTPFLDIEFRNELIRINKSNPKAIEFPVSGATIEAEMVYIGIDLLPPKNITGPYVDTNEMRGIHPVSEHVNNLLLGLDTPIFCFLDGGIADGRLYVIRNDTTRILLSIDSDFDSTNFRNIIKGFSDSNPILDMDDERMRKLLDLSDLLSEENQTGTYNPNINFKKEDSVFSFIIGDKLLISFIKQLGFYQMRIDKTADEEWGDLIINKDEKLEFYITTTDDSSIDSNFDTEVQKLFTEFQKRISDFEEDDLDYWYGIIKGRANSNISQLQRDIPLEQQIAELIWSHAAEYEMRLESEGGDVHNMGAVYDDEEKIGFIKMRIIAFGAVFKYLLNLESEISLLINKYNVSVNPTKEKLDLELAHAKASLYGAIKYAKSIAIPNSEIADWYSGFQENEELIQGQDPMANLLNKYNLDNTEVEDVSQDAKDESHASSDENDSLKDKLKKVLDDLANERNKIYDDINNEKDLKKQETLLRGAMKEKPDELEFLNLLAYNQYDQKKFSLGISFSKMAIDRNPDKSAYYDTCGLGYYYKGEYDRALELMSKGIELDPEGEKTNILEHYYNRGNVFVKMNNKIDAINDFEKVISLEQKDADKDNSSEMKRTLKKMSENALNAMM